MKERSAPWHQQLQLVTSALNAGYCVSSKCVPFECIYGHKGLIGLPDLAKLKTDTTRSYITLVNGTLRDIHNYVTVANQAVNDAYLSKANNGQLRKPPEKGDRCCLYRPMSTAAGKREPWVGEYLVLEANDYVTKVKNVETAATEWVSNHHVKVICSRPKRLELDDDWDESNLPILTEISPEDPCAPSNFKGGEVEQTTGVKPPSPTVEAETVPPGRSRKRGRPPRTTQTEGTAASKVPRRSGRIRQQTRQLNIASTRGKSYD